MRKRLTKTLILFVVLNLLLSGCVERQRKFIQPIPFDKKKWLGLYDDVNSDWMIRTENRPGMARYLIEKEVLIGKSYAEVIEMLGEHDDGFNAAREVRYSLEDIYGRNIDPIAIEYLKLIFNGEDKVEKAEIEFYKTSDWSTF
jgi:hypothetical protein